MRAMIQTGVVTKIPGWYSVVCQIPPVPKYGRGVGVPPKITFPTDRLLNLYKKQNPSPLQNEFRDRGDEPIDPIALKFSALQLRYMQQDGMNEDAAYNAANAAMGKERDASLQELRGLADRYQRMGSTPLFATPAMVAEYKNWKTCLQRQPYHLWSYKDVIALDDWLMNAVLRWGKTRQLYFKEDEFMQQFELLRKTLFPEVKKPSPELQEYFAEKAVLQDELITNVTPEKLHSYMKEYRKLYEKVHLEPALAEDFINEIESWVQSNHIFPDSLESAELLLLSELMFPALKEDAPHLKLEILSIEQYAQVAGDVSTVLKIRDASNEVVAVLADCQFLDPEKRLQFSKDEEVETEECSLPPDVLDAVREVLDAPVNPSDLGNASDDESDIDEIDEAELASILEQLTPQERKMLQVFQGTGGVKPVDEIAEAKWRMREFARRQRRRDQELELD